MSYIHFHNDIHFSKHLFWRYNLIIKVRIYPFFMTSRITPLFLRNTDYSECQLIEGVKHIISLCISHSRHCNIDCRLTCSKCDFELHLTLLFTTQLLNKSLKVLLAILILQEICRLIMK